jgi:hypothetical protein
MMARENKAMAGPGVLRAQEVISKWIGDGRRRTGSENLRIRRVIAGNPAAA